MLKRISISTHSQVELVNITSSIEKTVSESGVKEGVCYIFVPHTTAGITINEGADPSVKEDIINQLNKIVPFKESYLHLEGNSPAHIKASIIGSSEIVFIEGGHLVLGTWQSLYFCEFDGPRRREVLVKIVALT
ncbi:YjbQ family protein [Candidatus Aerophobetes bacterium]|nr:YjbQ family protein [Candidatus Aerophobetes bacterium]